MHPALTFRRWLLPATLLLAIAGCGGSGGGPKPSSDGILVRTDWSGGTAQSERITILRPTGATVSQTVVERAATTTSTSFVAPSGAYQIKIEESASAAFGTPAVGVLTYSTTGGSSSLTVAAGVKPTALQVTPASINLAFGQTFQIGVTGTDGSGNYAFLTPGALTFTPTGATATISAAGLVTASNTAGSTTIAVNDPLDILSTTATVNVQSASVTRGKWTVLVFLNAANDLYPYALPNVKQMAQVAYNSDTRFVLQWKEVASFGSPGTPTDFDGTRRYVVTTSTPSGSKIPGKLVQDMGVGVDMGKVQTLKDFIAWGMQMYPADHYIVDLWNHGNGWQSFLVNQKPPPSVRGISYDFQTGSEIDTWVLPQAFAGQHVDCIAMDACLMQMAEIADDLKSSCSYIAASEENTPGPGYPYQRIFKAFADNPSGDTTTLLHSFVTGHIGNPDYQSQPVTQSILDVSKLGPIETAIDTLAGALIANKAAITTEIPKIRTAMQKYASPGDGRNYYDLVDLAQHLSADTTLPTDVRTAANGVVAAVPGAIIWEGHSTLDAMSHGLAIDFSSSANRDLVYYGNMNLAKVTRWLTWLEMAP